MHFTKKAKSPFVSLGLSSLLFSTNVGLKPNEQKPNNMQIRVLYKNSLPLFLSIKIKERPHFISKKKAKKLKSYEVSTLRRRFTASILAKTGGLLLSNSTVLLMLLKPFGRPPIWSNSLDLHILASLYSQCTQSFEGIRQPQKSQPTTP